SSVVAGLVVVVVSSVVVVGGVTVVVSVSVVVTGATVVVGVSSVVVPGVVIGWVVVASVAEAVAPLSSPQASVSRGAPSVREVMAVLKVFMVRCLLSWLLRDPGGRPQVEGVAGADDRVGAPLDRDRGDVGHREAVVLGVEGQVGARQG